MFLLGASYGFIIPNLTKCVGLWFGAGELGLAQGILLVGFSIGSETLGSIVSPSTRCGVTGLRPTFGRVSRHGAMALSWSMDKIGPICRSAEDCALVFNAIYGPDDQRAINGDPAGIAEVTRALEGLHTDPLTPHLVNIRCPALLVVGEHDPLGVKATEICARNIPAAEIRVVDGAGHWVHADRPDAVLDAYDAWSSR